MEQMVSSEGPQQLGNHADPDYDAFLARLQARFLANTENGARPLFTTDTDGLWEAYLGAFPASERQFHNCSACRHFVQRFGGLVVIDAAGRTSSAVWHEDDAFDPYLAPIAAMKRLVRKARVTGVFLSSHETWGQPVTGVWRHMALQAPRAMLHRHSVLTAGQAMAEKREDYGTVSRALAEFSAETVAQALHLLKTDALYRAEKVIGPAGFLQELHKARDAAQGKEARANVTWLAVAKAPAGFCHPRSSMVGTLLEDIAAGKDFDEVSRAFKAKMHPLQYQRPQAAPSAGNIAQAEKLVEQLGIAPSLRRRFARVEEVEAVWRPRATKVEAKAGGVFADLVPKEKKPASALVAPAQAITWEKFARTVLPDADVIELLVPAHDNFGAIVTAADPLAPPILQWDREEQRNPFSVYVWHGGSSASCWGLRAGSYTKVTAITLRPNMWHDADRHQHHGKGVALLLEGARETRHAGLALFPESLRSELHAVRATIEAHSQRGVIEGDEDGSACGLLVGEKGTNAILRVTSNGLVSFWKLERWD